MKRLLIAMFAGLLIGGVALADPRKGGGEIGVDLGFTEFDSNVSKGASAPRLNLRAGWQAARVFQLEGQLGIADRNELQMATAFVNGVFCFPIGDRTVPYFLLGGGAARLDVNSVDDTAAAAQIAGGVRAYGREGRVGLRLELGGMWEDTFSQSSKHVNLVVGFTFDLSKRHVHRLKNPIASAPG